MSVIDAVDATTATADYLRAIAAVEDQVGDDVFAEELAADFAESMPAKAIVVGSAGGIGNGSLALDGQRVDVRSYGATLVEAKDVALAAHRAMKALSRQVVSGCLLHSANPSGGFISLRDPNTDWPFVLRTYQVLYAEISP